MGSLTTTADSCLWRVRTATRSWRRRTVIGSFDGAEGESTVAVHVSSGRLQSHPRFSHGSRRPGDVTGTRHPDRLERWLAEVEQHVAVNEVNHVAKPAAQHTPLATLDFGGHIGTNANIVAAKPITCVLRECTSIGRFGGDDQSSGINHVLPQLVQSRRGPEVRQLCGEGRLWLGGNREGHGQAARGP